jgi:excisionase family DNA binding protein
MRAPLSRARMWTHEETAAYLGIEPQTLYFLNHKGTGPRYYKVGRYCRYRPAEVDAWLESQCAAR